MRVVGIALLAGILSAGCALQPGDAGDEGASPPGEVTSAQAAGNSTTTAGRTPKFKVTGDPQGAASARPVENPDPSPWMAPGAPPRGNGGNPNANPDPSPWSPTTAVQSTANEMLPASGGSGNGSGNSNGAKPAGDPDPRVGHWHLYEIPQ